MSDKEQCWKYSNFGEIPLNRDADFLSRYIRPHMCNEFLVELVLDGETSNKNNIAKDDNNQKQLIFINEEVIYIWILIIRFFFFSSLFFSFYLFVLEVLKTNHLL